MVVHVQIDYQQRYNLDIFGHLQLAAVLELTVSIYEMNAAASGTSRGGVEMLYLSVWLFLARHVLLQKYGYEWNKKKDLVHIETFEER